MADLIPYHKMSVLIIEDLAEMRSTMKSMLSALGVQQIDTVNNGEDGLQKMQRNKYDIVLSDYELGRGKDGQQILEEVRHSQLLPAVTTYIVVTAAQTAEMVMGVLESEPDGYIAKPVTLDILRTRLNRIIRTKSIYREINQFIDKEDVDNALEACSRLALEKPKFALPAYRIKGKLLIKHNRLDEAKDMYDTVLGIKKVAWAVLGMGKVEFLRGNYAAAQELLEGLSKTNRKFVEALDWLASTLEAEGQIKAAQQVLEQAIDESPKSVVRQQNLARIAELNADADCMFKASRKAYGLSKHSVFRNVDGLLRYGTALLNVQRFGGVREQKMALKDITLIVEAARTEFQMDEVDTLRAQLLEAQAMSIEKNKEAAKPLFDEALAMADACGDKLDKDQQINLFAARLLCEEDEDKALAAGDKLLASLGQHHRLQTRYYATLDNFYKRQPEQRLPLLITRGEQLLERGFFEDAHLILSKALTLDPSNEDLKINALKAVVNLYKSGKSYSSYLEFGNQLFNSLRDLPKSSPNFSALEKLRLQWQGQDDEQAAS